MKSRYLLALVASVISLFMVTESAAEVQELYSEAQRAYLRGDVETAKPLFEAVLELQRNHQGAINYLRRIRVAEAQGGGARTMQRRLEQVTIDSINLDNASLSSVVDYLAQKVSDSTEDDLAVNFVLNMPREEADNRRVTITLNQIPFLEALTYITNLAGVQYRVEAHAIVVTLPGADS